MQLHKSLVSYVGSDEDSDSKKSLFFSKLESQRIDALCESKDLSLLSGLDKAMVEKAAQGDTSSQLNLAHALSDDAIVLDLLGPLGSVAR